MKHTISISLLLLTLFTIEGCEKVFKEQPSNDPVSIFDNLWNTFNEEYAPFEERDVDWSAQYSRFRPMLDQSSSEDELFDVLSQLLATLDDGHVNLTAPGREVFNSNEIRREKRYDDLFSTQVVRENYLEPGFKTGEEDSYIYGKIRDENIGYILFDHVGENFFKLDDFLDEFKTADGLIIDLRHNQGGDFTYCFSEIGRLTNERRFVFKSKTRNGPGRNDYTPWKEWYIEPSGDYVNKPVIVLTDRYTISAGERSVMAFMTLPNVITMGDTTNGAHGTMIGRELANGWFYSLVPQKVELFDGQTYEGIGLAPDVFIRNLPEELASGIDRSLQNAIDQLR
jgi:carboxyl-terminal processing protease